MTALVLRSSLRAVISTRVHLPVLQDAVRAAESQRRQLGLVVVGEGQPYGRGEITKALGIPVVAGIADDAGSAGHFSDGLPRHRKFESAPLIKSVRGAATTLAASLQRTTELVRSA